MKIIFKSLALGLLLAACNNTPSVTGLKMIAPTAAVAGDAVSVSIVQTLSNGQTQPLAVDVSVMPSTIIALPSDSTAASPFQPPMDAPTATFLVNSDRPEHTTDLRNVLFILDPGTAPGTLTISATIGNDMSTETTMAISPMPTGDATRGATLYGDKGANCADCHGATGHGSPLDSNGTTYTLANMQYAFPAPGLNAEPGNVAADPNWTPAYFAMAARADINNSGLSLREPMPDWLTTKNTATGQLLSTQDFADIFAFLATQTH